MSLLSPSFPLFPVQIVRVKETLASLSLLEAFAGLRFLAFMALCGSRVVRVVDLFFSYAPPHVSVVYALGASPELIKDTYYKTPKLLPTLVSPGYVTKNFIEHLDDKKYHGAYFAFFSDYLQSHSPTAALNHFYCPRVLLHVCPRSRCARLEEPVAFARPSSGGAGPSIYLAYGLEFGVLGQVIKDLVEAATHGTDQTELILPSYFTNTRSGQH